MLISRKEATWPLFGVVLALFFDPNFFEGGMIFTPFGGDWLHSISWASFLSFLSGAKAS